MESTVPHKQLDFKNSDDSCKSQTVLSICLWKKSTKFSKNCVRVTTKLLKSPGLVGLRPGFHLQIICCILTTSFLHRIHLDTQDI